MSNFNEKHKIRAPLLFLDNNFNYLLIKYLRSAILLVIPHQQNFPFFYFSLYNKLYNLSLYFPE